MSVECVEKINEKILEGTDEIDSAIYRMTVEIEKLSVEWIFRAIDVVKEKYGLIYPEARRRLDLQYGQGKSKEKTYVHPKMLNIVIDELVGINIYNAGQYYIQRGISRNKNAEVVVLDTAKEYTKKRSTLKKRIVALVDGESIRKVSQVTKEIDGRLGCLVFLESGDTIEISTITAGGWNVQKFHFRGIAKRKQNR